MKIYVIRHGETTGDIENRFGGAYDDELSPEGHNQCLQLAEELATSGITHIITSSLKRAQQTGEYLAKSTGATLSSDARLRERNQYGPLTGLTKQEAEAAHPGLAAQIKSDRYFTAPDAESYEDFRMRITEAFAEYNNKAATPTALIWHGGAMRVLFRDILKRGELEKIGDCAWVELEKSETGWQIINSQRITFGF